MERILLIEDDAAIARYLELGCTPLIAVGKSFTDARNCLLANDFTIQDKRNKNEIFKIPLQ
ncbi:hypothetical protein [Paenibacillus piri]|uniref:Uncharacterized protein n=1 Tax=Paenibacillus piri TaxID=2547395 RepID=A0A4R5KCW8_9BACL|nr:hypothetical protein [Paenibacillus piri]TDF93043.1 hypothetical protein E1757_28710 [Paenibacillus piri]